jgi:3-hydroxyacyl-[acyl-carrier-protein] dehydratase
VAVELNQEHAIFKGHFPGQPVLPGVCMMQMITEISGEFLKQSFRITDAPMIKFLHMIDPRKNPLIYLEIKYDSDAPKTFVSGKIFFETEIFMKFQIYMQVLPPHLPS